VRVERLLAYVLPIQEGKDECALPMIASSSRRANKFLSSAVELPGR